MQAKLVQHLSNYKEKLTDWFIQEWKITKPLFYCSVDLRNSGYKVAPIDTNVFPAGFNNLDQQKISEYSIEAKKTLARLNPGIKKILIIPENHTRNMFYFENIYFLQQILNYAGFETQFGSLILPCCSDSKTFVLESNKKIDLYSFYRNNNIIVSNGFVPDAILLNNDLANGIPEVLQNLDQVTMPQLKYSWSERLKSLHFQAYQKVCEDFALKFDFDPWLIFPIYSSCSDVEFLHRHGEECLMEHIAEVLDKVQKKFNEHKINEKPFVVVKADAGTYGMAVMSVNSPEQIRNLNRRERTHMATTKGSREVTKVIIQEGLPTIDTWGRENFVAEPVIYLIGASVIGGFLRVNSKRNNRENLNSPGMEFKSLELNSKNNFLYKIVAELAALAAARENF